MDKAARIELVLVVYCGLALHSPLNMYLHV